jgi:SAM-dependent methyltransferase
VIEFVPRGSLQDRPQPTECAALLAAEDRHFWFSARNHVIGEVMRTLVSSLTPGYRVLEVGCGTGNVLRVLEKVCGCGAVVGSELCEEGLRYARGRVRCQLVQADARQLPFRVLFDVIGLFDVLEHLSEDGEILDKLHGRLTQGGRLVLTVPAHQALWSYADDYAGHYRRYSRSGLDSLLTKVGFRVDQLSYFMAPLLPLMWIRRRLSPLTNLRRRVARRSARELTLGDLAVVPVLNGCLARLLALEAPLLARGRRLPLGTSLLAIATKVQPAPASSETVA